MSESGSLSSVLKGIVKFDGEEDFSDNGNRYISTSATRRGTNESGTSSTVKGTPNRYPCSNYTSGERQRFELKPHAPIGEGYTGNRNPVQHQRNWYS